MNKKGMDTAVCREETEAAAIAQLLPEMREHVIMVYRHRSMRDCYPDPVGILKECVI